MSLFGEKYGDVVRVVEIGGEFSRELCGGTHVGSSAEIGSLTLLTESSVGSGNRRVEALVGLDSFNHLAAERTLVNQLTGLMKVQSSADLPEKINQTLAKLKAAEKELAQLRREKLQAEAGKLLENAQTIGSVRVLAHDAGELDANGVRELALDLRSRFGSEAAVVAVVGVANGRPVVLVATNEGAREAGVKAGALVRVAAGVLGGGGGGDPKKGRKYAEIAVDYTDLRLITIDDLEEDDVLLTASLVGAPNAANQYMTPKDIAKTVEILQKNCDFHIGGIITNEQGGEATVNGWLQAAVTGLPVVDAPCNGRAHPTGVMGSMNLHKIPDYTTVQACVGGNPDTGNHIECFFEGNIDHTSKMVRLASIEAGGLVAVARNPVKVSYARQNCAIGGVSFAIETGKAFLKGLETSVEEGVNSLCTVLNGRILARGPVQNFSIETTGGFDVGYATVDGCDMTFWNEYATVEKDGERLATSLTLS